MDGSTDPADEEATPADEDATPADEDATPTSDGGDPDIGEAVADDPTDAIGLLGHFYRGQMDRVTTWRSRLDRTSYWAVTVIAALLTWVFSGRGNPHYLLLVGMGATTVFLGIETRRYRVYDVWRERVRLLEQDLFVEFFDPDADLAHGDWRRRIGDDLRNPSLKTGLLVALARRLRRIYYSLLLVLLAAWVVRVTAFQPGQPWQATASVFAVPGGLVAGAVAAFYLALTGIVVWGSLRRGGGEFHERRDTDPWRDE